MVGPAVARDRMLEEAYRRVFRYQLRLVCGAIDEAQDLAHETMLRVVRSLGTLKDPSRFVPWVLTIAANVWRDARRRKPESSLPDDVPAPPADDPRDSTVLRRVDALPEPYRAAVALRYIEGLDYDAMEQVLGTPAGTLRSHVARGLRMIRQMIERGER